MKRIYTPDAALLTMLCHDQPPLANCAFLPYSESSRGSWLTAAVGHGQSPPSLLQFDLSSPASKAETMKEFGAWFVDEAGKCNYSAITLITQGDGIKLMKEKVAYSSLKNVVSDFNSGIFDYLQRIPIVGQYFTRALNECSKTQRENYEKEWNTVEAAFNLVVQQMRPKSQAEQKVVNFMQPENLKERLDLQISSDRAADDNEIMNLARDILNFSVKSGHPFFMNTLSHGTDPYGYAAVLLEEAINNNMVTFEMMPSLTIIENHVIDVFGKLIGWERGYGTFCPGGSYSGMYGISLARHNRDPNIKHSGMFGSKRFIIFATDMSHFSVTKAAAFMGFGTSSVVKLPTDDNGGMIVSELIKSIEKFESEGCIPLMVWCTSGTTVLNGYDPLESVADICKKYGLWLHVDAALGGWALFSREHRSLISGIERADSVSWCWHKILGAPFQTSLFLTNHKDLMMESHSCDAKYLFADKYYDSSFDSGDASAQCGRKGDALKVFLILKARGTDYLGELVDQTVNSAQSFASKIGKDPNFKLVLNDKQNQGTTVCFWVVPPSFKSNEKDFTNHIAPMTREIKK
uniref:Glutamate decarboxylase n=1 Tax=Plectus sambesii TaxID=2011161 RepID=A0A914W520_9BILA